MKRLLLFALLIYTVSALSCVAHDKKRNPDIQVIEVDDSSKGSGKADIQIIDVDDSSKGSGSSDIQVIELDDSSKGSSEREVLALHLPNRRRREAINSKKNKHICKKDSDCGPGLICLANVACVKGKRRIINSLKVKATN